MGIGVSGWRLARAVAATGQLGVVSGVALDTVLVRRLQLGDPDHSVRDALAHFPVKRIATEILERYFVAGGIDKEKSFANFPRLSLSPREQEIALIVAANFVEIFLAKRGHDGLIGVNYLEKIQMATPASLFGAMLAGVDYVLIGAGIPAEIPHLLDELSLSKPGRVIVDVVRDREGPPRYAEIDPCRFGAGAQELSRPTFLAIVGSHVLAQFLARDPATCPDGFVVESPTAGGHSAPPRGRLRLDEAGQPLYSDRDRVDAATLVSLGLPFWLAGGYGSPEGLATARHLGATGIQVGSPFALCRESGITESLRRRVIEASLDNHLSVHNSPRSSPTGFPFKVACLAGTLSEDEVRRSRKRVCDLGYLRVAYERPNGTVGYRCAGEPVRAYLAKGGSEQESASRDCLCNGLLATIGLGQRRPGSHTEPPIVTMGQDLSFLERLAPGGKPYSAADVVAFLCGDRRAHEVDEGPIDPQ